MGIREDIQKRIEKKQQELAERDVAYNIERASTLAYIQGMLDTLKSLPKEAGQARPAQHVLRPGSTVAQARDAIQKAGKPLHVNDILRSIGRPVDKDNRTSIGGSISNYVRKGEIFIRTAPNTFGLVGMEVAAAVEPPIDFGRVRAKDDEDQDEVSF